MNWPNRPPRTEPFIPQSSQMSKNGCYHCSCECYHGGDEGPRFRFSAAYSNSDSALWTCTDFGLLCNKLLRLWDVLWSFNIWKLCIYLAEICGCTRYLEYPGTIGLSQMYKGTIFGSIDVGPFHGSPPDFLRLCFLQALGLGFFTFIHTAVSDWCFVSVSALTCIFRRTTPP